MNRWTREILIFVGTFGAGFVCIPLILAALDEWTRQALFVEMLRAFWTYLSHLTVYACLALYVLVMLVRGCVWGIRRLRTAHQASS